MTTSRITKRQEGSKGCSIPGCDRKHSCMGYCSMHYRHFKNTGKVCSVNDCGLPHECKGYCRKHYARFRVHGDPLFTKLPRGKGDTFAERFWYRVNKTPGLGPNGECWHWTGKPNSQGYGAVSWNGRTYGTHRVSWFLMYRKWPQGLLRHICDNPPCCNPSHLLEGTRQDNTRDMVARNRQSRGEHRPTAKLTNADVLAIRSEPQTWGYLSRLAKKYGLNPATVCRVRHGQRWRHVL